MLHLGERYSHDFPRANRIFFAFQHFGKVLNQLKNIQTYFREKAPQGSSEDIFGINLNLFAMVMCVQSLIISLKIHHNHMSYIH